VAIFRVDRTRTRLRTVGFYGEGLHPDLMQLWFDISAQKETESEEMYLTRLGVAGRNFTTGEKTFDNDLQSGIEKKAYRYKLHPGEAVDNSIISIPISSLRDGKQDFTGVLTISSVSPNAFSNDDLRRAYTFAGMLASDPDMLAKGEDLLAKK
jgi:hypothetical protein